MTAETHSQLANFIWSICNLLRGPYKRNEYRKVILPLTVLRRFDCLLAPTKAAVLEEYPAIKKKPETVVRSLLQKITKRPFYNLSKLDFKKLLDDPNQLAPNLNSYINKFSANVRDIVERFGFDEHIARMAEKNLLYEVIKAFAKIDLSSSHIDNVQMGYVFEELIRIGAEQANEEAGEHFTPREVIKLMVNLLLSPEKDLTHSHVVKTIYDPACGTGGMLSVSENYIRELNSEAKPILYGQDWNDDAWAVCKSDMLIKGEDADNIILGDTFSKDGFPDEKFDYMLANPPFGVEWKQQQRFIEQERDTLGFQGRFGVGTPRVNDGSLLFLQHMLSKMRDPKKGGSRIGIVFNGSPLFTGDAGSGESEIRRWTIENDWLEAIVALPDQLFYNTGISTYLWILTNRKTKPRRGKIQLIDARNFWIPMKKSLGNKRHKIGDAAAGERDDIGEITRIYGSLTDGETRKLAVDAAIKELAISKIFDNADFGFQKITVERPLRLAFEITDERLDALEHASTGIAKIDKLPAERREHVVEQLRDKARPRVLKSRDAFDNWLKHALPGDQYVTKSLRVLLRDAFNEPDETAEICTDARGKPEP
jgi:type I restriction enzyme M protein